MEEKYEIGTKIKTVDISEGLTDIYGVPNGALGKIIGYGDSAMCFYHVEFDESYVGDITIKKMYLSKDEVEKI